MGALAAMLGGSPASAAESVSEAPADATCTVERLPVPKQTTDSWVNAGSPSGDVLAGRVLIGDTWEPVLWFDGDLRRQEIPLDDPDFSAVNSSGRVVGFGMDRTTNTRIPFTLDDGQYVELPTATPGADATVVAVNENGTAVGREMVTENGSINTYPVRWSGEQLQDVERLGAAEGVARGVGDDGSVVGYSGNAGGSDRPRARVWRPDGSGEFLPVLGDHADSAASHVRGRYAVGNASSDADHSVEILWDLQGVSATKLPDSVYAAYDVNASGAVAAATENSRAAIVYDGTVTKLPRLSEDHPNEEAYTLSDDGTAAGSAEQPDGNDRAVVWRGCMP